MTTPYTPAQVAEAINGEPFADAKTRLSEEAYQAAKRKARALGYRSFSEYVRDAVHIATFGADAVHQCHNDRLCGLGQPLVDAGPESGFGSAL